MHRAAVATLTACAVVLSSPVAALAKQMPQQNQISTQAESSSVITVEETGKIASNCRDGDEEFVLKSERLTGDCLRYRYIVDVPAGYLKHDVRIYIEHDSGDTQTFIRSVESDGPATISLNLSIRNGALITSTIELWDANANGIHVDNFDVGPDWNGSLANALYDELLFSFSHSLRDSKENPYKAELICTDPSEISFVDGSTTYFDGIQKLDASDRYAYYVRGYRGPIDGAKVLASLEYHFLEQKPQNPWDEPPHTGVRLFVGKEYAGKLVKLHIDSGVHGYEGDFPRSEVLHIERYVDESGYVSAPFGSLQLLSGASGDYFQMDRFASESDYFTSASILHQGRITVELQPDPEISPTTGCQIIYNDSEKEIVTHEGMTISIYDSTASVSVSSFYSDAVSSSGYEKPSPGGKYLGSFVAGIVAKEYETGIAPAVIFRASIGVQHANSTVKVFSASNEYSDTSIDEIFTATVGKDGCFLIRMPLKALEQSEMANSPVLPTTSRRFYVNLEVPVGPNLSDASLINLPHQTWTGKPVCPKPLVRYGETELVEDVDYTLAYEDNVDPGTGKVIITGTGIYKGRVEQEFLIKKDGEPTDPDTPVDPGEDPDPDSPGGGDPSEPTGPDVPTGPGEPVDNPYQDLAEDKWYYGAVLKATELGIMNGYGDGTVFGAEDTLAREQAAAVLYNYLGEGAQAPAAPMPDVLNSWYTDAVNWAVANGVMDGYEGQNKFGIGDPLSREQFCAVIAKAVGADTSGANLSVLDRFPDASEISPWARPSVAWAVESGVIGGVELPDGTRILQPVRNLIRGEMAAMVVNAIEQGVLAK